MTEDEKPFLLTKSNVASMLQVSLRQVEYLVRAGRIPAPVYIGERTPRWRRDELLTAIETKSSGKN